MYICVCLYMYTQTNYFTLLAWVHGEMAAPNLVCPIKKNTNAFGRGSGILSQMILTIKKKNPKVVKLYSWVWQHPLIYPHRNRNLQFEGCGLSDIIRWPFVDGDSLF